MLVVQLLGTQAWERANLLPLSQAWVCLGPILSLLPLHSD